MSPLIYSGGVFSEAASLPVNDHAALYGAGFFETFRTRNGDPVRLEKHLARLHDSCRHLGIRIPDTHLAADDSLGKWLPVIHRLLKSHGLNDGVFRLTLTAGANASSLGSGDYLAPREILTCRSLPPEPSPVGVTLHLLKTIRDTGEWRPRPKSLNYLNSLLAARELAPLRRHPADEGLMVNAAGNLCEGVFSNLVWIRAGTVFTPDESTGLLPGVGRAHLLARLKESGVPVVELATGPEELFRADAIAMVSSVRGVVPVAKISDATGVVYWETKDAGPACAGLIRTFGQ